MSFSNSGLGRNIATHTGAFVSAIAIGAVLTLGIRSLFVDLDGSPSMAAAAPTGDHHAAPGHDGHAHDGAAATPADDGDGHGAHGKKHGDKADDGHDGHGADEPKQDDQPKKADQKQRADETDAAPKFVPVLLELGNATCPVMGGEPDGETYSEWSGLRVAHCCPGCKGRFQKNPESLLDEVSPKWREAVEAAKAIDSAEGEERAKLLKTTAKTWKVVREPVGRAPAAPSGLLVDLGNATCPVMGGEPDGETWSEWNGLRVGHCCPGCTKRFLANPEALLDEAAPQWREAAAAVKTVNDAEGAAQKKALDALRKKWTVVREPASTPAK